MKGLIISSGNISDYKLLMNRIKSHDFILCADGGIRHLMKVGAIPHLLIGDLDSIDEDGMDYINKNDINIIKHPIMKDETDSELALEYLINKGFDEITLSGVTGSRMDHTISNILLLKRLNEKGIKGKLVDDYNTIFYISSELKIQRDEGYYTSVIPASNEGAIVTLEGFLYPLKDHYIQFGSTLGVSNQIVDDYGLIMVKKGECIIISSKD